jgi:hypothetical protein
MTQPSTASRKVCCVDQGRLIPPGWLKGLSSIQSELSGRIRLRELLDAGALELVIITLSPARLDETEACGTLSELADQRYDGWVLPCVQKKLGVPRLLEETAQRLGLRLLPPLEIPFSKEGLQRAVTTILQACSHSPAAKMAEGVETWADFLAVRELGFDLVQGFLFAEPMTLEQLVKTCWTGRANAFADEMV